MSALAAVSMAQHDGDEPSSVTLPGPTKVPMSLYSNKPVIEAKINGKGPFRFFLDTGAGATVLSQDLANELNLPTDGRVKIGDPADPQAIDAPRNKVAKLEIGDAVFSDLIAVSFDRSMLYQPGSPRGVLGMPLFRSLLLTIDYPQSQIRIAKGSLPSSDGKRIVNFKKMEGGVFGVPLKVAEAEIVATIDTGATSGISFPESMMDKVALAGKPVEIGRGRTVGGESIVYGAKFAGDISLGEYKWPQPDVRFFGRLRNVNVGYSILNAFAITIDQQNSRMRFEKGALPTAAKPDVVATTAAGTFAEFAGLYGERRLTAENDSLFLQRISGPNGEGPRIKLTQIKPGEFALEGQTEVRVKFVRGADGKVESVSVLTPTGSWETAKRQ